MKMASRIQLHMNSHSQMLYPEQCHLGQGTITLSFNIPTKKRIVAIGSR